MAMWRWSAVLLAFTVAGCTIPNDYEPKVDTATSHPKVGHIYANDLSACQRLSDHPDQAETKLSDAEEAAIETGDAEATAGIAAGAGPFMGGALGAVIADQARKQAIVRSCLSGRGWNVVAN